MGPQGAFSAHVHGLACKLLETWACSERGLQLLHRSARKAAAPPAVAPPAKSPRLARACRLQPEGTAAAALAPSAGTPLARRLDSKLQLGLATQVQLCFAWCPCLIQCQLYQSASWRDAVAQAP